MYQLSPEEQSFRSMMERSMETTHGIAVTLPPQTAKVFPGGAEFSSITDALDSIVGSSVSNPYSIAVGPGTYTEAILLKPYVHISGAGTDKTTITYTPNAVVSGVVQAVGNSGIGQMTVVGTGGPFGSFAVGIFMVEDGHFHAGGVNIVATDSGMQGNNVRAMTNNSGASQGTIILGSCTISATATGQSSIPLALESCGNGYNCYLDLCTVSSSEAGWGVVTVGGSQVTLQSSAITGQYYSLYNSDGTSLITANNCVVNGPISGGVVVNNSTQNDAAVSLHRPAGIPVQSAS